EDGSKYKKRTRNVILFYVLAESIWQLKELMCIDCQSDKQAVKETIKTLAPNSPRLALRCMQYFLSRRCCDHRSKHAGYEHVQFRQACQSADVKHYKALPVLLHQ